VTVTLCRGGQSIQKIDRLPFVFLTQVRISQAHGHRRITQDLKPTMLIAEKVLRLQLISFPDSLEQFFQVIIK
jgi:hypothetical protein